MQRNPCWAHGPQLGTRFGSICGRGRDGVKEKNERKSEKAEKSRFRKSLGSEEVGKRGRRKGLSDEQRDKERREKDAERKRKRERERERERVATVGRNP